VSKPRPVASTSSCASHLHKHEIFALGQGPLPTCIIDDYLREQQQPFYAERFQTAFIDWIVATDTSFEAATHPKLREVILLGGPTVKDLLPSRNTIRSWLLSTYTERLSDVKNSILNARSKIVLSLDSWLAPNNLSLLGVVGYWIDNNCVLKTALLGLCPLDSYTGSDITDVLRKVVETFDLTGRVSAY
jgi:hypothetical protein